MNSEQDIDPDILSKLTAIGVPPNLVSWLAKLSTFQGVPFNYLVGDERFLAPESIKFFQVDPRWQNCLLDGALSIGRHYEGSNNASMPVMADKTHLRHILDKTNKEIPSIRKRQLKIESVGDDAPIVITGFLLRSKVVSAWKTMDVIGYAKGSSPYDYEQNEITADQVQSLDIIRLERLSADVMLGLFNGALYELVFHQPPEAVHFGFLQVDFDNYAVSKNIRVPVTNWDDPNATYDNNSHQNQSLKSVFYDTNNRVLNMTALSQALAQNLNSYNMAPGYYMLNPTDTNYRDRLVSSDFALEMVQGVGLVSFINGAGLVSFGNDTVSAGQKQ